MPTPLCSAPICPTTHSSRVRSVRGERLRDSTIGGTARASAAAHASGTSRYFDTSLARTTKISPEVFSSAAFTAASMRSSSILVSISPPSGGAAASARTTASAEASAAEATPEVAATAPAGAHAARQEHQRQQPPKATTKAATETPGNEQDQDNH